MNLRYSSTNPIIGQPKLVNLNLEQATSMIVERAKQLVDRVVEIRGNNKPPFSPEEFARLIGIKKIVKANLGKISGVLLRLQDGFVIKVNQDHNQARQNFSCAHEIGHLLFSELKLENYTNTIEYRTFNPQAQQRKRAKAIEKLCDEAATELLMPASIFNKHLLVLGTSINSIEQLAKMFRVSIQSAAIRASEISQKTCIVLKWQLGKNQSKSLLLSWPKRKLVGKVQFSPLNKIVDPPSVLHKAYNCDGLLQDNISFKVGKETKRFPAEIKGFGRGENRYVISLAFIDR
jgi:Zn-dependent peptidase ImmA (M78 family)